MGSSQDCYNIVSMLYEEVGFHSELSVNLTSKSLESLQYFCGKVYDSEVKDRYSKPMVWIGIYIAVATSFCVLAMAADLLHGFWNKKFWFPFKYFSLNAASITVITVVMKLPVDLSGPMPGYVDQTAKLGSMAFLCIMMPNLMPSLASTDNMSLLVNLIGLAILVITIIVDIFIEINTGVIYNYKFHFSYKPQGHFLDTNFVRVAYVYMAIIIFLLLILASSALIIPSSKKILELKYQATSKVVLDDQHLQHTEMSITENLRQHVRRYWIMAKTGNPQFVITSNPLSSTCCTTCVIVLVSYAFVLLKMFLGHHKEDRTSQSDYRSSMIPIVITQFFGVLVGTIAPILRRFTILSLNLYKIYDMIFFSVEKYWIQKLYEWKDNHIAFRSSGRRLRTHIHN